MRRLRSSLASAAALAVATTGIAVATTGGPAQAAGCRSTPYSAVLSTGRSGAVLPTSGTWRTTTQCRDIQVRGASNAAGTTARTFQACVIFVDKTSACNYWSTVRFGQWTNIATNVKDGVRFRVKVRFSSGIGVRGFMDF